MRIEAFFFVFLQYIVDMKLVKQEKEGRKAENTVLAFKDMRPPQQVPSSKPVTKQGNSTRTFNPIQLDST